VSYFPQLAAVLRDWWPVLALYLIAFFKLFAVLAYRRLTQVERDIAQRAGIEQAGKGCGGREATPAAAVTRATCQGNTECQRQK
jgi:hypothetical protein